MRLYQSLKSGYTLVELSVVIIIVGLLTAGGLAVGASMVERAAYIDTQKLINQLDRSLKDYYIVNGSLPCVASLTIQPGQTDFGEAIDCNNPATPAGTFREGSPAVRIGMIPTRTLGLSDSAAQDKYGSRIIYAVSEELADPNTFGANDGAIRVEDMADIAILSNAAYFIASVGRDRKGGYSYNLGDIPTDCGSSGNLDVRNCVLDDVVFRDAPFNNGDVEDMFFDDITQWVPKFHLTGTDASSDTLWSSLGDANLFSVGTNNNTSDTNVGIGTSSPAAKLHVNSGRARFSDTAGSVELWHGGSHGTLRTVGNTKLTFGTNNTEAMHLLTNGNFGIGLAVPTQRLHVAGNEQVDGDIIMRGTSPTIYLQDTDNRSAMIHANSDRIYFLRGTAADSLSWDGTRPLTLDLTNIRAGVGTASPAEAMHVVGNLQTTNGFLGVGGHGANYMHLAHSNYKGSGQYAMLQHGTAGHLYLNSVGTGTMYFRNNNNTKMSMDSDANVRIHNSLIVGKTNIDSSLDGQGQEQASSPMKNNGFISTPWVYARAIEGDQRAGTATRITLGYGAPGTDDDEIGFYTLGSLKMLLAKDGAFYLKKVPDDTTSNGSNVRINPSSGRLLRSTSSRRYKKNIEPYTQGLDMVKQLKPAFFQDKREEGDRKLAGFIAEDIDALGLSEFVTYDEEGRPDALEYGHMTALLAKALQDLAKENEALKARLDALETDAPASTIKDTESAGSIPAANIMAFLAMVLAGLALLLQHSNRKMH